MSGQLVLICGDDDYLVESAAREYVREKVPSENREWGLEVIDGIKQTAEEVKSAITDCMLSVQTPAFFGGQKLTWLKNALFFAGDPGTGKGGEGAASKRSPVPGDIKESIAKMTEWLKKGLPDGQNLLVTAVKISRASAFFKTCQKMGKVTDFGGNLRPSDRERMAKERLDTLIKQAGLTFASGAKQEFLKRSGTETRLQVQELEKLKLYLYPEKKVSAQDIQQITSIGREAVIWDLTDALGERDAFKALSVFNDLSDQKGIGIMLSAILAKRIKEWLSYREALDRGWIHNGSWAAGLSSRETAVLNLLIPNYAAVREWAMRKNLTPARNYTINELRKARFYLLEMREKLVSTQLPERLVVETTLLKIIGKPNRALSRKTGGGAR